MSYLVLARKYRPKTFADIVGQENAAQTLRGAISDGRVGHAYLFCGPRGTGKTTTARIFAKALNCEKGPTPEPCGVCERCVAADDGSDIDIIEIDAASNTGVDDVRLLRDSVAYAPMRARFKVYIIDEVHMLSRGAFNAFLKTLEEPPSHVKFLFATTDPQKVPETIISRCQVLKLAPMSEKVISARLEHVFALENVRAGPGVVHEIARRARGGMRDALSLADQLLSLVGTEPAVEDVARLSEGGAAEELDRLIDCIANHDKKGMLQALPRTEGGEGELLSLLLEHLRASLVAFVVGAENPLVQESPERARHLRERGERLGLDRLQNWLEELLMARERMRVLPSHARAILEVTLLDLCREESSLSLAQIATRMLALEQRLAASGGASGNPSVVAPRATTVSPPSQSSSNSTSVATPPAAAQNRAEHGVLQPVERAPVVDRSSAPRAAPSPIASGSAAPSSPAEVARPASDRPRPLVAGTNDAWARFLEVLTETSGSLAETLRTRGKLADLSNGRALVQMSNLREGERTLVFDPRNQKAASAAFSKAVGSVVQIALEDQSVVRAKKDPYTAKIAEMFDGRIEDEG